MVERFENYFLTKFHAKLILNALNLMFSLFDVYFWKFWKLGGYFCQIESSMFHFSSTPILRCAGCWWTKIFFTFFHRMKRFNNIFWKKGVSNFFYRSFSIFLVTHQLLHAVVFKGRLVGMWKCFLEQKYL